MERFVIGAALFAAVAIAAGGYFGHAVSDGNGFRFEIDGEPVAGGGGPTAGPGAPVTSPSTAYGGAELKVRNAVAILKIIPEDRTDIAVEIANPGVLATPTVRVEGGAVIVDGGIASRRIHNCRGVGDEFSVDVRGVGAVGPGKAPVITARVPRAVKVSAGGAVETDIGPSASMDGAFAGCGDTKVADTAGALSIDASGSGEVTAGAARSAKVSLAGSGDAAVGAVAEKLSIALAGSGGVTAASAAGPVDISIAGSGDVTVGAGPTGDAEVSIAGSGDVSIAGDVQKLDASIAGSGDITVTGKAASVDASIMGSGDVSVAAVTGNVQKTVMGSGSVNVGR